MNGIFEKLGARAYALPLAIIIAIACVMSLAFFPMAHMEPKSLPFAILTLDAGAATPQGEMNAGETLAEAITSQQGEDGEDAAIAWTRIESEDELDEALENNEFYGAIIIPEDFTATQIAAQAAAMANAGIAGAADATPSDAQAAAFAAAGAADASKAAADSDGSGSAADAAALAAASAAASSDGAQAASPLAALAADDDDAAASGDAASIPQPATAAAADAAQPASITVLIDNAKSPMVAVMMQQTMASMFSNQGIQAEIEVIHAGDSDSGETSGEEASSPVATGTMSTMMSQQISIMPLFIMSAVCGLFISRIVAFGARSAVSGRFKAALIQAALIVAFSLAAALAVYCVATFIGGIDLPFADAVTFFWLASMGIMLVVAGLADIAFPLGVLGILLMFSGMACGVMPVEMLPAFWQDWIYPWVPQAFIGQGIRAILYMGAGAINVGSLPLAITGLVGIVLIAAAACIPGKAGKAGAPASAGQSEKSAA